jgi:hypothetical protein
MDCNNCNKHDEKKEPVTVPLFAVEGQNFRANQTSRHLATMFCVSLIIIAIIIGLCGMVVYRMNKDCLEKVDNINRYWIDYFSECDIVGESYDYTQDGRGLNIIGDNNGVTAYESETSDSYTDYSEEGR